MKIHKVHDFKGEFFKILETTEQSQLGVMTIPPSKDSGPEEIHKGDQIIYIIEGKAKIQINSETENFSSGQAIIIPLGAKHHIWNQGSNDLFFITLYAPPAY